MKERKVKRLGNSRRTRNDHGAEGRGRGRGRWWSNLSNLGGGITARGLFNDFDPKFHKGRSGYYRNCAKCKHYLLTLVRSVLIGNIQGWMPPPPPSLFWSAGVAAYAGASRIIIERPAQTASDSSRVLSPFSPPSSLFAAVRVFPMWLLCAFRE